MPQVFDRLDLSCRKQCPTFSRTSTTLLFLRQHVLFQAIFCKAVFSSCLAGETGTGAFSGWPSILPGVFRCPPAQGAGAALVSLAWTKHACLCVCVSHPDSKGHQQVLHLVHAGGGDTCIASPPTKLAILSSGCRTDVPASLHLLFSALYKVCF